MHTVAFVHSLQSISTAPHETHVTFLKNPGRHMHVLSLVRVGDCSSVAPPSHVVTDWHKAEEVGVTGAV